MLEKPRSLLWGDTVNGNIDRYIERYWNPVLRNVPKDVWNYEKVAKKMTIGDSFCDFRSADNPQNWEGFGYDIILLNEAGIILRNPYLYENAVRPMLLDNPESILIAGGTPKGKQPPTFYELWKKGQEGFRNFQSFQYSTYDNPYISEEEINELIEEMSDAVVEQEIYGKFTDATEWQFIEGDIVDEAVKREHHDSVVQHEPLIFGIDIAGSGANETVLYKRRGNKTIDIQRKGKVKGDVLVNWFAVEINKDNPDAVFLDGGFNPAVIDILISLGHDVTKVDFAGASSNKNYYNKRAEIWGGMRDWLAAGGAIPNDRKFKRELTQQTFEYAKADGSCIKLTSKKKMIEEGLPSPDTGDACALTFAFPVRKKTLADKLLQNKNHDSYNTDYSIWD